MVGLVDVFVEGGGVEGAVGVVEADLLHQDADQELGQEARQGRQESVTGAGMAARFDRIQSRVRHRLHVWLVPPPPDVLLRAEGEPPAEERPHQQVEQGVHHEPVEGHSRHQPPGHNTL